ncbi:MAG: PAC2 family protein [Chloroflexota bacterium]
MTDLLRISELPELRDPHLVIGLAGWTNAADVSTGSVTYLKDQLKARKFGDMDHEPFTKYTSSRPTAAIENGRVRRLAYPKNDFYYWSNPDKPHDLVLFIGTEPDLMWPTFTKTLLDLAVQLGVSRICAVGGYYDSVAHTGDVLCSGTATDEAIRQQLQQMGVGLSTYFGPTGMLTALLWEAQQRNIPAVSIWGRAPHYIQVANPNVWHQVLWRVGHLCNVPVDTLPLMRRGQELNQRVSASLKDNPQLREHVAQLEANAPAAGPQMPQAPGTTGPLEKDDVLRSVEEFLRGNQDPPVGGP